MSGRANYSKPIGLMTVSELIEQAESLTSNSSRKTRQLLYLAARFRRALVALSLRPDMPREAIKVARTALEDVRLDPDIGANICLRCGKHKRNSDRLCAECLQADVRAYSTRARAKALAARPVCQDCGVPLNAKRSKKYCNSCTRKRLIKQQKAAGVKFRGIAAIKEAQE